MSKNSHAKHEHKQNHRQNKALQGYEKPHEDYHAGIWGDVVIFILIIGLGIFFVLPFYGLLPYPGSVLIIITFLLIIAGFALLIWRRAKRKK